MVETELSPPAVVGEATKGPAGTGRSFLMWAALVALLGSAVVGSNVFSLRDRLLGSAAPKPALPATSRVAGASTGNAGPSPAGTPVIGNADTQQATSLRSQPWWQDVATLQGTGTSTTSPFTISDSAIQWRVSWSCGVGQLVVRMPKRSKALVEGGCPDGTPGYAVQTGSTTLQVTADGQWQLQIAQEIDAPLVEPPAPAMTAFGSTVAANGSFYRIDQTGTGKAVLYDQADGQYSLRLVDFFVSPTTDLELRMSSLAAPHSSQDVMAAPSALVVSLDVTAGSLNYIVPATVDPTKFHSLYVWCSLTQSAYAGASLVAVP